MIKILMALFAISVVVGMPSSFCGDMGVFECVNPARFITGIFGPEGVVSMFVPPAGNGISTAIITTNPDQPSTVIVTSTGPGPSAGRTYSSASSNADASSKASVSAGSEAGSTVTGPDASTKTESISQASSHQLLNDAASTATAASTSYAVGSNGDGDKEYAGALSDAQAFNLLGSNGVGIAHNGAITATMITGKSNDATASALDDTAINLGKEKINTRIGIATATIPGKPVLGRTVQISTSQIS